MRWLIRRLLAKNPRERFAHTADLAADLRIIREFLAEATSARGATPARSAPAAMAARARPRWRWSPPPRSCSAARSDRRIARRASSGSRRSPPTPAIRASPAWSPDGKTIAYEAEVNGVVQIFTRDAGSPMRTQVTTVGLRLLRAVLVGRRRHIYYHSLARDSDALWRVSPAGGAPQVVIEGATRSAISPDGKTLVFLREESAVDRT